LSARPSVSNCTSAGTTSLVARCPIQERTLQLLKDMRVEMEAYSFLAELVPAGRACVSFVSARYTPSLCEQLAVGKHLPASSVGAVVAGGEVSG
jgi:hypothetical protein